MQKYALQASAGHHKGRKFIEFWRQNQTNFHKPTNDFINFSFFPVTGLPSVKNDLNDNCGHNEHRHDYPEIICFKHILSSYPLSPDSQITINTPMFTKSALSCLASFSPTTLHENCRLRCLLQHLRRHCVLAAEDYETGAVVEVVFDAHVSEAGGCEEGGGFDAEGFIDFDYAGAVCREQAG